MSNFLNKKHKFAIVGASNDNNKKGFFIFEKFLQYNLPAFPVSIEETLIHKIQMIPCFPDLRSVRPFPDSVLITDTDPEKTLIFLQEIRDNNINRVWLEEETIDNNVLKFCNDHHFVFLTGNILDLFDEIMIKNR